VSPPDQVATLVVGLAQGNAAILELHKRALTSIETTQLGTYMALVTLIDRGKLDFRMGSQVCVC
jgi:hypothetical protein